MLRAAVSRVRFGFPHFDVVHFHGGILAAVLIRVPGRVPLAAGCPKAVSLVSGPVLPGLGVGAVGVLVREEAHSPNRHVHDQVELQ